MPHLLFEETKSLREINNQWHENIQIPTRRTEEQYEDERQSQQEQRQPQQQSLNIENLGTYTNQPLTPYPGHPPPSFTDQTPPP